MEQIAENILTNYPELSRLLTQILQNISDRISTIDELTKLVGQFDDNQILRELQTPKFSSSDESDSSDDENSDDISKCHIVMLQQGDYSDTETKSVVTFRSRHRARKLVHKFRKVLYSHHPMEPKDILAKKLSAIHPNSLLGNRSLDTLPVYDVQTCDFVDD